MRSWPGAQGPAFVAAWPVSQSGGIVVSAEAHSLRRLHGHRGRRPGYWPRPSPGPLGTWAETLVPTGFATQAPASGSPLPPP